MGSCARGSTCENSISSGAGDPIKIYAGSMAGRWPLTGRSEEMRHVEAAITTSRLSGIVVCGPAGVGKSRLARETLQRATSGGCEVRWAVGTSSAKAVPLGAFAEWAAPGETDTLGLVRGLVDALTSVPAGRTRVVLGVDDAHLLDDLSAFALHLIVRQGAAKVVMTVRDGEPIPAGVLEVWRAADFEWLDLPPLSREDTFALLSATLGGPMDPVAAQHLWRLTRGNALYLHNIVEQGLCDGLITLENRYWRWSGDPVVPADLVEMIEARVASLPAAVNDVIDALAVAEPIALQALQRIADPAAVEQADCGDLIVLASVDGGVEVRLAHPLYGEVRRRSAPPTRLRRLRALVANELAAGPRSDDIRVVVRRAALSVESDLEPDPDLLLRAAQGAVWLADLPLAARLADAAIGANAGPEAYLISAHALSWLGLGQQADDALCAIPDDELDGAQRARVAFLRAANMLCAMADPLSAKAIVDDAMQRAPGDTRDCLVAFHTVYWAAMGCPDAARAASLAVAMDRLPAIVGAVTAWAITLACGDAGRTADALAAAEAGYAIAESSFDAAQMRFVIADAEVGALLLAGRIEDAVDAAERIRGQAADLPGAAQLLSSALAGRAALAAGHLDTACALLGPAVDLLFTAGDTNGFGYQYHLPHTVALAMQGCPEAASAAFTQLEAHKYPSWRYLDYSYALAAGWVAACRGAVSEAIRIVSTASAAARATGQFAAEVLCLQTATQFGGTTAAQRLHELEAIVDGPRTAIAARFADALHDGDGASLDAVSADFERMGDLVAAVDAAAYAALAHHNRGRRGSALGSSARAEVLAERCGGAHTPALRRAVEPLPLTAREREIVMLLGEGLSSRAVSERLVLSVRTVESHIYKAMTKTGTSSREELAGLITRSRTPTP